MSKFDIFDLIFTYSNEMSDITCCRLDRSPVVVSCGQGVRHSKEEFKQKLINQISLQVSCSALCDRKEAKICPSRNCAACSGSPALESEATDKPEGRIHGNGEDYGEENGNSPYTQSSSSLNWCNDRNHDCRVKKFPKCCERCKDIRPKAYEKHCDSKWFEGKFYVLCLDWFQIGTIQGKDAVSPKTLSMELGYATR